MDASDYRLRRTIIERSGRYRLERILERDAAKLDWKKRRSDCSIFFGKYKYWNGSLHDSTRYTFWSDLSGFGAGTPPDHINCDTPLCKRVRNCELQNRGSEEI